MNQPRVTTGTRRRSSLRRTNSPAACAPRAKRVLMPDMTQNSGIMNCAPTTIG